MQKSVFVFDLLLSFFVLLNLFESNMFCSDLNVT